MRAARDSLADLPGIETARLSIVGLRAEDAQVLRQLTDDPAITAAVDFLPTPFTLQDAEDLIRSGARGQDRFLGAWMRTGGLGAGKPAPEPAARELVGVVGTHLRGVGVIEIGYWIGGAARGRGFAFEAVSAIIGSLGDALSGADHRGGVPARQRRLLGPASEARLPRYRRGGAPSGPPAAPAGLKLRRSTAGPGPLRFRIGRRSSARPA